MNKKRFLSFVAKVIAAQVTTYFLAGAVFYSLLTKPYYEGLLAVVRGMIRYHGIASGPANREFVVEAVDPALARAGLATAQDFDGTFDAALQLTALKQREVGRVESSARGSGVEQHMNWTPG